MLSLKRSYFSLGSPAALIDRWLNPLRYRELVNLRGQPLLVQWTARAHRHMNQRSTVLLAEMQLYFSCTVLKRVLFHDREGHDGEVVNDALAVSFRTVEALSCDPVAFASNHPVKRDFDSEAASKVYPKRLRIDYREGQWCGEFDL